VIAFWRRYFMPLELGLALAAAAGFIVWTEWAGGWSVVNGVLSGSRHEIYSTVASIAGALLGFVLTAASIVLGYAALPQLSVIRNSPHYKELYEIFFQATGCLSCATLAALLALVFDREALPVPLFLYLTLAFLLLSTVRVARCIWVLQQVVTIVVSKPPASGGAAGSGVGGQ